MHPRILGNLLLFESERWAGSQISTAEIYFLYMQLELSFFFSKHCTGCIFKHLSGPAEEISFSDSRVNNKRLRLLEFVHHELDPTGTLERITLGEQQRLQKSWRLNRRKMQAESNSISLTDLSEFSRRLRLGGRKANSGNFASSCFVFHVFEYPNSAEESLI